jgi:hypothetical protein
MVGDRALGNRRHSAQRVQFALFGAPRRTSTGDRPYPIMVRLPCVLGRIK